MNPFNSHPEASQLRQLMLNVGLGFAVAMLLLLGVIVLSVSQMAEINKQLHAVVSVNNVKTRLATRMRDTLRDRAIIMHDIVVSIDPWEKDMLFQEFMNLGERYAKDRAQLLDMQDSNNEKNLLDKLDEITSINQPIMFDVVSAAMDQNNYGALTMLQEQAIPLQKKLVAALDEMTSLQREANESALKKTYTDYTSTRNFILLLGGFSIFLVAAVAIAVSRKVATQTRLLDTEKLKFQTLFESNSDAVVILGSNGFIDCNLATLQMFHMQNKDDFLHTPITKLGAVKQRDNEPAYEFAMRHIKKAQQEGHAFMEWIGLRTDGNLFPSEIALHSMQLNGKPVIQAIMRDISERKLVEAELQKAHDDAILAARAKSEFIANVSHEVRTPMHGILGMSDMLLREPLTGKQREYAATLRQSARGMLNVINDILDFSKIEAGKLSLEFIPFDLQSVINSVAALYRPRALEKSIELIVQIDHELPQHILGDPHRLRQILLNFVDNAIKFTPYGQIHLRAKRTSQDKLRIEIQDNGPGIPAEARDRIFSAFSQADTSTTRKYGGTGLGLAICSQLAKLMQGEIGVNSPSEGSRNGSLFWLEIPVTAAKAGSDAVELSHEQPQRLQGRVLIAEDNPVNQKVLSYQLDALGIETQVANNGREAVELAVKEDWDLILMDWQMPEMDGLTAAKAIRNLHGQKGKIPIVALTAQSSNGFREQCLAAGMNDYLTKPYEESLLISVLAQWLPDGQMLQPDPLNLQKIAISHKPDRLREMFQVFTQTSESSLEKLQDYLEQHDAASGKREAHNLRGAAAAMSATPMFEAATRLENAFQQESWQQAENLMEDLQAEYLRLRLFLEKNQASSFG